MTLGAMKYCPALHSLRLRRPLVILFILTLLTAGASRSSSQETHSRKKDDANTVRGTVLNSVTHAPVGRALVHSLDNRFAGLTDDEGHFEFKVPRTDNAPPQEGGSLSSEPVTTFFAGSSGGVLGNEVASQLASQFAAMSFQLRARKPGYLADSNVPQMSTASNESRGELVIPLVPEALLTGRVNLPSDAAADRAQVQLYRRQVQEGRGQWVQAGFAMTDSEGEFRFADLPAGEYKVFTGEILDRDQMTLDPRAQFYGFPPVYFPNATDFDSAGAIRLTAGGSSFANLTPVRREYYPVRIAVANGTPGVGRMVSVFPQGHEGPGYSLAYDDREQVIEGFLPNGAYTLQVASYGESTTSGQMNFSVRGGPFAGHALTLMPNSSISVSVKHELEKNENPSVVIETLGDTTDQPEHKPNVAKLQQRDVQVTLIPADDFKQANTVSLRRPKSPEDESLVLENVEPGRYRVRVDLTPVTYIAAVSSGGTDLLRQPLVVAPGVASPPIEIIVRDDGAHLEGEIEHWAEETKARGPSFNAPGQLPACVYLVPVAESSGQFRVIWISQDGRFEMMQIPPGEYQAFAFDRQPVDLEYENTEDMRKYEGKGQGVHLGPGATENLKLSLISTDE